MLAKAGIKVKLSNVVAIIAAALLFTYACTPDSTLSASQEDIFRIPSHFPEPVYGQGENALEAKKIALGRKLFYDPVLSVDGTVSCASCHHQESAFSDEGKALSTGINGKEGLRNSPALFNLAWIPAFMADGGINHIEVMPIAPITDSLEMGEDLAAVIEKLQLNPDYAAEFKEAFEQTQITAKQMLVSLAHFMASMVSLNSLYDQVEQDKRVYTPLQKSGAKLFETHCASCHQPPLFTDFSYRNNGLDQRSDDPGRARITNAESDHGRFKVPSLRNISVTSPYMHDGRFNTLKEVLAHYQHGIQTNPNLDESLKQQIHLTAQEQQAMLAFLQTLTDYTYLTDQKYSKPSL
jgi:cytochrome c peroxidase